MLRTEFKNQVDNLMNILFGAGVASHGTIIEQINYLVFLRSLSKKDDSAMILDSSAEKIFSGELAKYHWDNLLVLNAEVLFTTLEEIFRKLPELATDQTIRLLYRDAHVKIFDKPTLRRLVHEIEKMMSELEKEASSGHTDIFGDMYEYLLSKQAQAGTLGQFRTPRHIINFIVDIIDPNKGETILDPACGTAGFLVSALEHLKEKYTSDELKKEGRLVMDKLNKGERDFVYQHTFTGFDSDFDMFKFGLMNLYLHKLEHPNIKRQNTLVDTAGDRTKWDVILANPPFAGALDQDSVSEDLRMNTRATEVLFLKYIVDHLSQNGRAGVIVPEGVVFNSTSAHKKIRQILVEDAGLWCVVSLPSGVFNPYAGVKTSILFFDKNMKDKFKNVLFYKIDADGFELGAQRRGINKNDLPHALEVILNYRLWTQTNQKLSENDYLHEPLALLIDKSKISESADYVLSSERYVTQKEYSNAKWPMVEIGKVCTFEYGKPLKSENRKQGQYPVFGSNGVVGYHNDRLVEGPFIIVGRKGTAGAVTYSEMSGYPIDTTFYVKLQKDNELSTKYFYYVLKSAGLDKIGKQAGVPGLNRNDAYKLKIPLPPLSIQKQIVEELDGYQKITDGATQVVKNWNPTIEIDPEWKTVKLPQISENLDNKRKPVTKSDRLDGVYPYYGASGIVDYVDGYIFDGDFLLISEDGANLLARSTDIAFSISGKNWVNNHAHILKFQNQITQKFVEIYINQIDISKFITGMAQPKLNQQALNMIEIPLPSLEVQEQITKSIEAERVLVEGNKKLFEIYQQKIKNKIESLWNTDEHSDNSEFIDDK